MKHASLTSQQIAELQVLRRQGTTHRQRQRAHAVLLSAKGYSLDQLADIFDCDRDTISRWLESWQQQGLEGLVDAPKSGRPPKLDATAHAILEQVLSHPVPNLKGVVLPELKKRDMT